jgi:TatD DNase family protein
VKIFETHCHLNNARFDEDRQAVTVRARTAGVTEFIEIGYDLESSRQAVALANPELGIYAAVGIHPHDAIAWDANAEKEIRRLMTLPGVVAIGEIGLDFYRDLSPREAQYTAFAAQLELAGEVGLPVIIHTRESMSEALEVLAPYGRGGQQAVLHCWSGSVQQAEEAVALGFYLGIGGVLTYKNAGELLDVARAIPLERLLLETDCPYLPPTPYRGKRNEPAYLPLIAERVAELKDTPLATVVEVTRENARRLFNRVCD